MLWALALAVAVMVLWWVRRRRSLRRQRALAAQLRTGLAAWPILGHTHRFLGSDLDRMKAVMDLANDGIQNGGISKMLYFDQVLINVADPVAVPTLLTQCLEKHDLMKIMSLLLGNSSLIAPVPVWRQRRRLMIQSFSTRELTEYCEVFSRQSTKVVGLLEKELDKQEFSFWDYMTIYSFDSVCETTMGVKMKDYSKFLHASEELWAFGSYALFKPWLKIPYKMRLPHFQKHYDNISTVRGFITGIINEKRKQLEINKNYTLTSEIPLLKVEPLLKTVCYIESFPDAVGGSVSSYLERQLMAPAARRLTDEALMEECMTLVVAGLDTTALAGAFTMLLLSTHPHVQDTVYRELEEVFGESERPVSHEDLPRLKYLEAVIMETLRLYPPVPLIARTTEKDIQLPSGLTVVSGCGVFINIWAVHRHPGYWGEDADLFRPERFLDTALTHPAAFMPFGYGPRSCIGSRYGMLSLKSWVSAVLRRYRVLAAPGVPLGHLPRPSFNMLLKHADDYRVRITARK